MASGGAWRARCCAATMSAMGISRGEARRALMAARQASSSSGSPAKNGAAAPKFVDKATWVTNHPEPRGKPSDKFPDVALIDQSGKAHQFYRDLVKDRTVVIQFFYTTCTGI